MTTNNAADIAREIGGVSIEHNWQMSPEFLDALADELRECIQTTGTADEFLTALARATHSVR